MESTVRLPGRGSTDSPGDSPETQRIQREYDETRKLIVRLYQTMTPTHYIESLLRDLDTARDNELHALHDTTISVRRCRLCNVGDRAAYALRTR